MSVTGQKRARRRSCRRPPARRWGTAAICVKKAEHTRRGRSDIGDPPNTPITKPSTHIGGRERGPSVARKIVGRQPLLGGFLAALLTSVSLALAFGSSAEAKAPILS